MTSGHVYGYNDKTGELMGLVPKSYKRHPFGFDWHVTSNEAWLSAFAELRGGPEVRVFTVLPTRMKEHNWIMLTVTEVASVARISVSAASKALSRLQRIGVLRQVSRGAYRFNPHIAWRGNNKDCLVAMRDWEINGRRSSPA